MIPEVALPGFPLFAETEKPFFTASLPCIFSIRFPLQAQCLGTSRRGDRAISTWTEQKLSHAGGESLSFSRPRWASAAPSLRAFHLGFFTAHSPSYFFPMGFEIVTRLWRGEAVCDSPPGKPPDPQGRASAPGGREGSAHLSPHAVTSLAQLPLTWRVNPGRRAYHHPGRLPAADRHSASYWRTMRRKSKRPSSNQHLLFIPTIGIHTPCSDRRGGASRPRSPGSVRPCEHSGNGFRASATIGVDGTSYANDTAKYYNFGYSSLRFSSAASSPESGFRRRRSHAGQQEGLLPMPRHGGA